MITILLTYLLVAVAVMMYAGVGTEGVGLGSPDNSENVFKPWPPRCWAAWADCPLPGDLRVVDRQPADHVLAGGAHHAGDGRLRRVPEEARGDQPALHGADVRDGRRGRRYQRLLRRGETGLRTCAVGHHRGAGHHDLLVLRHHRVRLCGSSAASCSPRCTTSSTSWCSRCSAASCWRPCS